MKLKDDVTGLLGVHSGAMLIAGHILGMMLPDAIPEAQRPYWFSLVIAIGVLSMVRVLWLLIARGAIEECES